MTRAARQSEAVGSGTGRVPLRGLVLSFGALLVPLFDSLYPGHYANQYDELLWLVALVPAFLLAYYKGWRGVAAALAAGMAILASTEAVSLGLGHRIENWPLLLCVTALYVLISLSVGMVAEGLHRERDRVAQLALTDALTGLPNRREADLMLSHEFPAAMRGRGLVAVLWDLDHFKKYNDRYGHAAGDEALRTFAGVLSRHTRNMNISARWGGEEFLSVLSEGDIGGARIFVERVREDLAQSAPAAGPITVSVGIASYHPGLKRVEDLVAAADDALYRAKEAGRDCVRVQSFVGQEREGHDHAAGGRDSADEAGHGAMLTLFPGPGLRGRAALGGA